MPVSTRFTLKFIILLLIFYLQISKNDASDKPYVVSQLKGSIHTKHGAYLSSPLNIYCYDGVPRNALHTWRSVTLRLEVDTEAFVQFEGATPDEVWNAYRADKSSWLGTLFSTRKSRYTAFNPFNSTCLAVKSDQPFTLTIDMNNFDNVKIGLMVLGVVLFLYARSLCDNTLFFYLSGISLGICASFLILIYFVSKMLPGKRIVYGAMLGGWTLSLYAFQFIWSNFQPVIYTYKTYLAWYTLAMGLVSFIICYKMGPPKDQRNKNLITWTLQAIALACLYYSTYLTEMFILITCILFMLKYSPSFLTDWLIGYWRRKFPKKRVLLTQKEYYEQGRMETKKALDELRGYCSSPECSQWKLMRKLQDPKKFASFVDGDDHLSEDEIRDYDTSDFIIKRRNLSNQKKTNNSNVAKEEYLTSDDSSLSSDELEI